MASTFSGLRPREKVAVSARDLSSQQNERTRGMKEAGEAAVAAPFTGITEGGQITPGLFPIQPTGVSTKPIVQAAQAFLASLSDAERDSATFPVDTDAWRRWSNVHMFLMRHGVCMENMSDAQREKAFDILRATLSADGFHTSRGIMKLNDTVREITGRDIEFGEWLYWVSIMGTPSETEPWGWQIDGHHLIINCFILGDQIVTTPTFMGSEPVIATAGKHEGTRVFDAEQDRAVALVQSLDQDQLRRAIIGDRLPTEVLAPAYSDNIDLERQGLRLDSLSAGQKELASSLLQAYTGRLRPGHAEVWLDQVKRHLDETYLSWIGGTEDDGIFYYRIHSPIVLIEFDHLPGIALDSDLPTRHHIHTIVRTPNGNDYGKDLLRQHYERSPHTLK